MTPLSLHFSLEELTFSQAALRLGIPNAPDSEQLANLAWLATRLLEPARELLGVPLHVDSGFRSPRINQIVGGSPTSRHMLGLAADCIPVGMRLADAFARLRASPLPIDRLIIECDAWLHLQAAADGERPRRIFETASGGPGHWVYARAA